MANNEINDAAKKVAEAEKKKDKKPANPNGNWFKRAGKAIKKFFKDLKGEIKKIVWPDGKTVFKSTLVVLAAVAICGLAIFGGVMFRSILIGSMSNVHRAQEATDYLKKNTVKFLENRDTFLFMNVQSKPRGGGGSRGGGHSSGHGGGGGSF